MNEAIAVYWTAAVRLGWGAEVAAFFVLITLRCNKDVELAKFHWKRLNALAIDADDESNRVRHVIEQLKGELTEEELNAIS